MWGLSALGDYWNAGKEKPRYLAIPGPYRERMLAHPLRTSCASTPRGGEAFLGASLEEYYLRFGGATIVYFQLYIER